MDFWHVLSLVNKLEVALREKLKVDVYCHWKLFVSHWGLKLRVRILHIFLTVDVRLLVSLHLEYFLYNQLKVFEIYLVL